MAKDDKILAIDIGATSIKLCEFDYSGEGIALSRFAHREYEEELSDVTRMGVVAGLLRQMMSEGGFEARKALICMSGQASLMRFNRLPTVNCSVAKIRQLAEFEATQNIPFDLNDVLWDYQLISNSSNDSVDIMSVVIKNDVVEQYTSAIMQVGCQPLLIDVASAACFNTAKACGVDEEGSCAIVLNIGGRVSNLIFVEGERFYARSIPIAGYTITQQIAKDFNIGFPEAEELKRRHGFVSLGGAYAEPESETAANVSKIIRNVMSRLANEVSRTISIYCAQQGGTKPTKMFITGGSSILTYCDTFFNEKLKIPVEYFNPFKCVTLLPTVDREKLGEVGHMFSETIGLGLRYASQCPVELSLIPINIRRQQDFNKKKPFFLTSIFAIMMVILVIWFGILSRTDKYKIQNMGMKNKVDNVKKYIVPIEDAMSKTSASKSQVETIGDLLLQQAKWPAILNEIYRIKPNNLWITSIKPIIGEVKPFEIQSSADAAAATMGDNAMMGPMGGEDMFGGMGGMAGPMGEGGEEGVVSTGQVVTIGGIEISGTSIIPDKRGVTFDLGQAFEFPFALGAPSEGGSDAEGAAENNSEASEGEETQAAAAPAPESNVDPNEAMAKAMKSAGPTPEQAFEAACRNSRIFNSDPTLTTITFIKLSDTVKNYTNFRMQLTFEMPVEFYQVDLNKGMGPMGPGPMMGGPGPGPGAM